MNAIVGICALFFIVLTPIILVAGPLTRLGVSGPQALSVAAGVVIGAFMLWRLR